MIKKNYTFDDFESLCRKLYPDAIPSITSLSILWADANVQVTILNYLRRHGFMVQTVDNAIDAVKFIQYRSPNLCILDVDLTPISGMDILEALLRDQYYAQTKVLLTSNHHAETLAVEERLAKIFGGVGVLKKPLTAATLVSELNNFRHDPLVS